MTKIKITRVNEKINAQRTIAIYLDEELVGTIANGRSEEMSITPGKHTLRARIDWCGSVNLPFELLEGERKEFTLSAFVAATRLYKYLKIVVPFSIGLAIVVLTLNKFMEMNLENWLMIIAIPVSIPLLLIFYYLTIGKNKYLVLKHSE